jgi:hypothetical protein
MTGPAPTIAELLVQWRDRADHLESLSRQLGADTVEGRVLTAAAAAVRECTGELESVSR